ncbi:PrsW family intramembrane metalloprotease [Aeromicrobium sp. 50.2.37]|uniref:PrsW family intramembrane metalloprotease n=1 Tax=Aeromicrobium sp. 50.2.37 TaxID=2969305 RepID=UPI00214FA353|nr:PrsW family intramembrane metalloprotease [Aeromicrobium sp. 50.2.37]MCR4514560.1 PrsW family intramembrane metalloprotease [Aeromicrobium sp. 50.2.37]
MSQPYADDVAVPQEAGRGEIPRRLPRYRETPRQRGRTLLMVLVGIGVVIGLVAVGIFAASAGDAEGARLAVLYAFIPLPVLWLVYWWLDRYEPEPRRYKVAAFVWGGVGAVAIALVVQLVVAEVADLTDQQLASFVAPLSEEPAKGLFLLFTFLRWRRIIDGFLDGLVVAGLVGLGFAFVENIGYYAASYLGSPEIPVAGAEGAAGTFFVRGVVSPFAHPLFTSAFGIALGLAVLVRSKVLKVVIGVVGMAVSVALHGLWNASLSYGGGAGFVLVYLALGLVLLVVGVIAVVTRVRQVRTLERSLSYVAERGWIHPAEIPYLSRFSYRKKARKHARSSHGRVAGKVVRRYQRLATEMAFLHDAIMSGHAKPHGVERTYALLDAMYALRPALRLPPPLPVARRAVPRA